MKTWSHSKVPGEVETLREDSRQEVDAGPMEPTGKCGVEPEAEQPAERWFEVDECTCP